MTFFTNRARRFILILILPLLVLVSLLLIRSDSLPENLDDKLPHELTGEPAGYDPKEKPKILYKPPPQKPPPIEDNFPLASRAKSSSDLPPIPPWNKPPRSHSKHATPLFIGFTRNWRLLQQTVVSYITAGWPPSDIYVVENTGVMDSNKNGLLSLQNPFYLNHQRLTKVLGVNVLTTPTLFTFAQLQNFFTYTALQKEWKHYFWAHMDTVALSDEEDESTPYRTIYQRAIDAMEATMKEDWGDLATLWFAYDWLALVRTQAFIDVGGWDTMVPFYKTDIDMHERLWMKGFKIEPAKAGKIWDVANTLDDLELLYTRGEVKGGQKADDKPAEPSEEKDKEKDKGKTSMEKRKTPTPEKNSPAYKDLLQKLDDLQNAKHGDKAGRNTWQASQKGGQGEPFYRDSDGFERAMAMWMGFGETVFHEKWGRGELNLREAGMVLEDQWRVLKDWEKEDVQRKYWRDKEREEKEKEKAEEEGKRER